MKTISLVAFAAVLLAGPAHAEFYVGVNGAMNFVDWKANLYTRTENTEGIGVLAGYRYAAVAGELSWSTTANSYDKHDAASTAYISHLTISAVAFDSFAFLPLPGANWFQPFVTAGAGYTFGKDRTIARWDTTEIKDGSITNDKPGGETYILHHKAVTLGFGEHEMLWRAGAGVAVRLSQDLTLRALGRYQPYDFGGQANGGFSFDIGALVRI